MCHPFNLFLLHLFSHFFFLFFSHTLCLFFLMTSTLYIFKISPSICPNPLLLLSSAYVSLLQEVFTSNLACLQSPAPSSYPIPSPAVTELLPHSSPCHPPSFSFHSFTLSPEYDWHDSVQREPARRPQAICYKE